jgi:predicted small metal-binding protein
LQGWRRIGFYPTYYQSAKSVIFSTAEVFKSCIQWRFDTKSEEEVLQNIADLHIKTKSDASS